MQNKLARKKAFTLVELAVAMAVTVVFLALISVLLVTLLDEKEETNQDARIAYELLLAESRVESWFYAFSAVEQGQSACTFEVLPENLNKVSAYRNGEEIGHISYNVEQQNLISSDRERVTEFKDITNITFEIINGNAVKITVSFESLKTPIVRLFTQKGDNYA